MSATNAVPRRVVAVVLAAGASQRLGQPKQLLDHHGEPLVRAVARVLLGAPSVELVGVITGCSGEAVERALAGLTLGVVHNAEWEEGMASSVRAAVRWAKGAHADALVITLVDQVHLSAAHVDALVGAWQTTRARAVGSGYAATVGVPALFDAQTFEVLLTLEGDRGAAKVLRSLDDVALVPWEDGAFDVDTPADLARERPGG